MNNINSWNNFSDSYLKEAKISTSTVHYGLCIAGEDQLSVLPDLKHIRVLDVGCGGGENCIALADEGAIVTGIEPCSKFYLKAHNSTISNPNIEIANTSWNDMSTEQDELFQCVLFIGSSEYIDLNSDFFSKLEAITSLDCFLLIARIHPMWTSLFNHETGPINYKSYFTNRIDKIQYGDENNYFTRNHYSIDELVRYFHQNNWRLNSIKEPKPVEEKVAPYYFKGCYEDPVFKKRLSIVPMTLILSFYRQEKT